MFMGHGVLHICYCLTLHISRPLLLASSLRQRIPASGIRTEKPYHWCPTHHLLLAALWSGKAAFLGT